MNTHDSTSSLLPNFQVSLANFLDSMDGILVTVTRQQVDLNATDIGQREWGSDTGSNLQMMSTLWKNRAYAQHTY